MKPVKQTHALPAGAHRMAVKPPKDATHLAIYNEQGLLLRSGPISDEMYMWDYAPLANTQLRLEWTGQGAEPEKPQRPIGHPRGQANSKDRGNRS